MNHEIHEKILCYFRVLRVFRGSKKFEVFFIDETLVKELTGVEPLRVVFRDNGFASDAIKINVEQVFMAEGIRYGFY